MTTGETLLAAIIAEPADDYRRLVYADWLDENAQPERAAFIRVQVELARIEGEQGTAEFWKSLRYSHTGCSGCSSWCRLNKRQYELLMRWREFAGPDATQLIPGAGLFFHHLHFARGFVEFVTCSATDWLTHGDAIRAAHPVTRVRLTTLPEWEWCDTGGTARQAPLSPDTAPMRLVGRKWVRLRANERLQIRLGRLLAAEWPGIVFELPPVPTYGGGADLWGRNWTPADFAPGAPPFGVEIQPR